MISQVVLGLQNPLTAEKGDKLVGMITLKPDFSLHRYIYQIANVLPLDFSDILFKSFSIPAFLPNRSSLRIHLTTSFSGPKSEESEEREYLLWKYSTNCPYSREGNISCENIQTCLKSISKCCTNCSRDTASLEWGLWWSTWRIIDNDQPVLNLFRSRIIFILNLEWRKRELWNT